MIFAYFLAFVFVALFLDNYANAKRGTDQFEKERKANAARHAQWRESDAGRAWLKRNKGGA